MTQNLRHATVMPGGRVFAAAGSNQEQGQAQVEGIGESAHPFIYNKNRANFARGIGVFSVGISLCFGNVGAAVTQPDSIRHKSAQ